MIEWVRFERLLRRQLRRTTIRVGTGTVRYAGSRPVLAHELLRACSDDGEEQQELKQGEFWPVVPLEFLEQRYRPEQWFLFYWDSIGPTSWASSLWLIHRDDGSSIVALLHEEKPLYLLGVVHPNSDLLLLSRLFTRVLEDNGQGFGINLFGSLPTETTNWRPDLVPEPVVKQAYWNWMQWAEQAQFCDWLDLEQDLARFDLEPNPMVRSLAALGGLPNLSATSAIGDWLDGHDEESAGFPDHGKQAILDWYFQRRYNEVALAGARLARTR